MDIEKTVLDMIGRDKQLQAIIELYNRCDKRGKAEVYAFVSIVAELNVNQTSEETHIIATHTS